MQEKLRELIKKYVEEELTTTGDADVYSTPHAFKKKKKKKVDEALEAKDVQEIRKLIRDVVGDILRDIWLKRTSWK
jgi:DNA replication initiation complex subunit (GINS family)